MGIQAFRMSVEKQIVELRQIIYRKKEQLDIISNEHQRSKHERDVSKLEKKLTKLEKKQNEQNNSKENKFDEVASEILY